MRLTTRLPLCPAAPVVAFNLIIEPLGNTVQCGNGLRGVERYPASTTAG